jgi:Ran GTPase-activating protein (RanGAP) involved in mRNA processing and transport
MINDLKTDKTPLEFTISGLNLLPAQIRILVQATSVNTSLKTISMSRKNISDHDGVEIAKCLYSNKLLENLVLEGNNLGPQSSASIGKLLEQNTSLRNIDLEGNDLTNGGKDTSGIKALAEVNISIIHIN